MPFHLILHSVKNNSCGTIFVTLFIFFIFFLANAYENVPPITLLSIQFIFPALISIQQIEYLIKDDSTFGILESEIGNGKQLSYFVLQKIMASFIFILFPIVVIIGAFIYFKLPTIDFISSSITLSFFLLSLSLFSSITALLNIPSFLIYILYAPLQIPLILWTFNTLSLSYCFIPVTVSIGYCIFMVSILFLFEDMFKEYIFN